MQEETTGDITVAREVANLLKRMDAQDELASARAHALQDMGITLELVTDDLQQLKEKLDSLTKIVEKYPAIDPQDIRDIKTMIRTLPCHPSCGHDPETRLHSVPCAGE